MFPVVHNVVFQHAENAAFLWTQRMDAIHHPDYHFSDLKQLDARVSANLRGLLVSGTPGRDIVKQLLASEEEGALFAYLVLLIEQSSAQELIDTVSSMDLSDHLQELEQAVAWANPDYVQRLIKTLAEVQHENVVLLGLMACLAQRISPPPSVVSGLLAHKSLTVRLVMLKLVATLRLKSHTRVLSHMLSEIDEQNLAVARAQVFTGQGKDAQQTLQKLQSSERYRGEALTLLLLTLSPNESRELLKSLFGGNERVLDVVRGFGLIGDPSAVPWLIEQTSSEQLARQAGAAIAMITGVDLALEDLDSAKPASESDDDDPNAPITDDDPDDDLAWPDTNLLRQWWSENNCWRSGEIYLMGCKADDIAELDKVLTLGKQPLRSIAAVRRALLVPDEPLYNNAAPGHIQTGWM